MNKFLNLLIKACFAFILLAVCLYIAFMVFGYFFACSSAQVVTVD